MIVLNTYLEFIYINDWITLGVILSVYKSRYDNRMQCICPEMLSFCNGYLNEMLICITLV